MYQIVMTYNTHTDINKQPTDQRNKWTHLKLTKGSLKNNVPLNKFHYMFKVGEISMCLLLLLTKEMEKKENYIMNSETYTSRARRSTCHEERTSSFFQP